MFVPEIRDVILIGSGLAVGVFCPAVCRKIKAAMTKLFTKGESALEKRVRALEAAIVKDGSGAIAAAEAEIKKL